MVGTVVVGRSKGEIFSVLPFWGRGLSLAGQKSAMFWVASLALAMKGFLLWAIDDAVVAVVVAADAVAVAACSGRRVPQFSSARKPSYFLR